MAAEWYYKAGNREVGPLSLRDLATIARQGRLTAEMDVRHGRGGAWITADRVPGLLQGAAGQSGRSTPPPLPSATNSLFDAIERVGPAFVARKMSFGGRSSLTTGLLCLGGIGVIVLLFIVVVLAAGAGDRPKVPKIGASDSTPIRTSPIVKSTVNSDVSSTLLPHRKTVGPAGNWMERIDESSQDSVVVVVNTEGNALGTGFVISADGDRKLLLTNKHVLRVGDDPVTDPLARQCYIKTLSGSVMQAKLAGEARDPSVDLALLLANSHDLRPLGAVKDFDDIHVGENVVSVGNPGIPGTDVILEGTVTPGIVSGKREKLLIQTTAPINHGNSGGPLVNEAGQVLGVNTMSAKNMQATNFAFRADWVFDNGHWVYYQDIGKLLAAVPRP